MKAGDFTTREFTTVHPDALIDEVAAGLQDPSTDPIPVCENQRLVGMLSPHEIAASLRARKQGQPRVRVRDVMAPEIIFCLESTELAEAAALMKENQVRRLPVLNADRKLVGLLMLENVPPDAGEPSGDRATPGLEVV
jgi:CBS domain-containing protein